VSQDSAARLERRARTLLRAYPADYRRDRAEELIGTLRFGLSIFLGSNVNSFLANDQIGYSGVHWLAVAAGLLSAAAAVAPWLGRRTVVTAIAIPAGALLAVVLLSEPLARSYGGAWLVGVLIAMSGLVALPGGPQRLPRSWLWLPCVPLAGLVAGDLLRFSGDGYLFTEIYLPDYAFALPAAAVACWLVTDARPAFGLIAAVLLTFLLDDVGTPLPAVLGSTETAILVVFVLPLAIGLTIMLALARLLHRQAPSRPRPLPKP
jgi:hypothetical protein